VNTELATARPTRPTSFAPTNLVEAMEFSKLIANSNFVPMEYRGKPGDILVCLQMGAELGLSPLSALQSISVINGKPSVWGDGAIALVQASGLMEDHEEGVEGEGDERYGYCRMVRRGRATPYLKRFSIADAKRAGLWGRNVWKGYPDVMLVARARSACMRAAFPDVLKGVITREEAADYPPEDEQAKEARPTSDLPTPQRASAQVVTESASHVLKNETVDRETGEVIEGTPDEELESTLAESLEVVGGAAPVSPSDANLPRSSDVVSEDGAAPSLLLDDLEEDVDEPVLINEKDRRAFHAARCEGNHPKDATKAWLQEYYGYNSTAEIQKDQLAEICARLRDPMPL
jgi:hypothetical protein